MYRFDELLLFWHEKPVIFEKTLEDNIELLFKTGLCSSTKKLRLVLFLLADVGFALMKKSIKNVHLMQKRICFGLNSTKSTNSRLTKIQFLS